jgi:hypothetical protein
MLEVRDALDGSRIFLLAWSSVWYLYTHKVVCHPLNFECIRKLQ